MHWIVLLYPDIKQKFHPSLWTSPSHLKIGIFDPEDEYVEAW